MTRSPIPRSLLLVTLIALTIPSSGATAQSVIDDATITQGFFARFNLQEPKRQITITGFVKGSAYALFLAPTPPAAGYDLLFSGCVSLRRGETLALRDEGCGEFQMIADPTLTSGTFVGSVPSAQGTITASLAFVGTSPPTEPAPATTLPPFMTAQMSTVRGATAAGLVQNDQGEGMDVPTTTELAVLSQLLIANSAVIA